MEICNGEKIMLFKSLNLYETPKAIESICHSYQIALEEEFVDSLILYHVLFQVFYVFILLVMEMYH